MEKTAQKEGVQIADSYKTALANYAELIDNADELGKQKMVPEERESVLAAISASAIQDAVVTKSNLVDANAFHAAVDHYVNWIHLPTEPCVSTAPKILLRMKEDPASVRTRSTEILDETKAELVG